jgi:hypothetical protein
MNQEWIDLKTTTRRGCSGCFKSYQVGKRLLEKGYCGQFNGNLY